MKKYVGYIPLIATAYVEIEAESEEEAYEKMLEMYDKDVIDLGGYDAEPRKQWWVEEE